MIPSSRLFQERRRLRLRAFALVVAFCGGILTAGAAAGDAPPISPREKIVLFNGKDLSGFYTWEAKHGREDPDRVFTVVDQVDGAPAIRLSGQHVGGIVTRERYANYRLVAEYRWGLVTWEPRKNRARAGSISLHCQGEDGNHAKDFRSPWMRAVEFFIAEGGVGSLILLGGYERGKAEQIIPRLTATVRAGTQVWDPDGTPTEFTKGRIHWRDRDPEWKDVLGFRGRNDLENPTGQWNRIEAVCAGGDVTCFVNGVKVNEGKNGTFTEGRIMIPSEGAEIFFRRIELHPLEN
ncbi:MAG: DUF1080 domain-containing protein [Verrucomicrobia bacterium]|nr:DUF1080 domain-containing protein [Verrucomicrobiota bacterium]